MPGRNRILCRRRHKSRFTRHRPMPEGWARTKGFEYARTSNPTRLALGEISQPSRARNSATPLPQAWRRLILRCDWLRPAITSSFRQHLRRRNRLFKRSAGELRHRIRVRRYIRRNQREAAIKDGTRMVFVETPTNPVMIVTDLKAVSDVAHAAGASRMRQHLHVAYLQRPMEFGVDIVVLDDQISQRPLRRYQRRRTAEQRRRYRRIGLCRIVPNPLALRFMAGPRGSRHLRCAWSNTTNRAARWRFLRPSKFLRNLLPGIDVAQAARPAKRQRRLRQHGVV